MDDGSANDHDGATAGFPQAPPTFSAANEPTGPKRSFVRRVTSPFARWWRTSSRANRAIGIALVIVVLLLFVVAGSVSQSQSELDESEASLADATDRVDELEADVDELESQLSEAEDQAADDLSAAAEEADERVADVRNDLRDRRQALDDREADLDQREADLTAFETFVENNQFSDGIYLVNQDIAPGRYRNDGGSSCYWERLSGLSGDFGDLIANDLPTGPAIVDIASTDVAFSTQGCGTWTKIG
jgi:hypothetical protein